MFERKGTVAAVFVVTLALLVGGFWVFSGEIPTVRAADVTDSKLKQLLTKKLAILQEVAKQRTAAYESGQTSLALVYEATRAVRDAELDLCDTDRERVAVLERMLAEVSEREKQIALLVQTGAAPATAALEASVDRLDVEIALERAKSK